MPEIPRSGHAFDRLAAILCAGLFALLVLGLGSAVHGAEGDLSLGLVAVALANARLSARSAKGYARFAKLTAPMLAEMSLFAVQTKTEAQRFLSLGARPQTVEVTGSIKFDLTIDPELPQRAAALRAQWGANRTATFAAP